jgi:2-methylcitrate dehydratase PrpD
MGSVGIFVGAREIYDSELNPTAVSGAVNAAAEGSRLRGLDRKKNAKALPLAASMAAGSLECRTDGSWTKRPNAGHAASVGVRATKLATAGIQGLETSLEGRHGFVLQYGHGIIAGRKPFPRWRYLAQETSIKFFPYCWYMRGGMDLNVPHH